MSQYEYPYTASMKGNAALSNHFQNAIEEDAQRIRKEILSTTPEDIKGMMKMIADVIEKNYYCVFGNEKKIKESKNIFTKIIKSKD
jgi:Zn-dependent M16 (insulinase) family peptidase